MWAVRAAVRRGLPLRPARRALPAPPPLPRPTRALSVHGGGVRGLPGRRGGAGGRDPRAPDGDPGAEDPDDDDDDDGAEPCGGGPALPAGAQRVCVVRPEVRGGGGGGAGSAWRAAEAAEAEALVRAVPGWTVTRTLEAPAGTAPPGRRLRWGRGRFEALSDAIRACGDSTAVFLDVEQVSAAERARLSAAWGVPVTDRRGLVLRLLRERARTREARLQLALAELPPLLGRAEDARVPEGLRAREASLRRALERTRGRREQARARRSRGDLPVVALVGYTNCGKTSLIRALTGDEAARPRDGPFATLDVTAHAGRLPSGVPVLYLDTVGFLSRLPHGLVQAFAATEDAAHADVLVHVRDASHPASERQKATVMATLRGLGLPASRVDGVLEVLNKVDLLPGGRAPEPGALAVSALHGRGLDALRDALDAAVLRATGRRRLTLRLPLAGPQLSWLYREAAVLRVDELPGTGQALVHVVLSPAALGRFRKLFPGDAGRAEEGTSFPLTSL